MVLQKREIHTQLIRGATHIPVVLILRHFCYTSRDYRRMIFFLDILARSCLTLSLKSRILFDIYY
jgi:hypothetical protein